MSKTLTALVVFVAATVFGLGVAIGHFTPGRAAKQPACPDARGRCTCQAPCDDCCCQGAACKDGCCKPGGCPLSDSVTVRSPDGKQKITLRATEQGAGLWMEHNGQKGPMVAIFTLDDMNGVGLYGPDKAGGMAIALAVDKQGAGYIQFRDAKGGLHYLTAADVARLQRRVGDAEPGKKE